MAPPQRASHREHFWQKICLSTLLSRLSHIQQHSQICLKRLKSLFTGRGIIVKPVFISFTTSVQLGNTFSILKCHNIFKTLKFRVKPKFKFFLFLPLQGPLSNVRSQTSDDTTILESPSSSKALVLVMVLERERERSQQAQCYNLTNCRHTSDGPNCPDVESLSAYIQS